jgi:hypothetical protein
MSNKPATYKCSKGSRFGHDTLVDAMLKDGVDAFSERQILKKNRRRCSLHRGGRSARGAGRSAAWCEAQWYSLRRGGLSAAWGRTVRGLVRSWGFSA